MSNRNNKTNKTTHNKKVYDENAIYNHVLASSLPIENIIHYINTRKILKAKYNKYNKLDYIDTTYEKLSKYVSDDKQGKKIYFKSMMKFLYFALAKSDARHALSDFEINTLRSLSDYR